jgi:hypothetical protein
MQSSPERGSACRLHAPGPHQPQLAAHPNSRRAIAQVSAFKLAKLARYSIAKIFRNYDCGLEQMLRQIRGLRVLQAPFGKVFWFLEQKIARLTDEIERRRA